MYFRPYPVLTVLTLAGLAVLLWLGSWQWSRMDEKAQQIAAYEDLTDREPVDLETALCAGSPPPSGLPVQAGAPAGTTIAFWGRDADGVAGWRIFAPVSMPDCAGPGHILQETGFTPFEGASSSDAPARWQLRTVPDAGLFDAANDVTGNEFYSYDAEAMAGVAGVDALSSDYWITADRGMPTELSEVPPSRHLGYAITWFGLAVTLIGVFAAFHAARGRLGFTRR